MPGGGGGNTETVQKSEPWEPIQGNILDLINRGAALSRQGPSSTATMSPQQRLQALQGTTGAPPAGTNYADWLTDMGMPGQSIVSGAQLGMVPFTGYEKQAQRGMVDYARGGLPDSLTAGSGELANVLGGRYLDQGNPYLEGMYQAATRPVIRDFNTEVLPAITAQFNAAGGLGSGMQANVTNAAADDLQRNLLDTAANIYGQDYASERENMMRALGLSPVMASTEREMDLGNLGLLGQVGGAQREMASAMLGTPNQATADEWANLMRYADILGQGSGYGVVTAQQPYYQNKMAGALGGAASGAGLGMMAGGPMGAGIGGGLGLLAGYFM